MISIGIRSSSATWDNRFGGEQLRHLRSVGFDLVELSFNRAPLDYLDLKQCEMFAGSVMSWVCDTPPTPRIRSE